MKPIGYVRTNLSDEEIDNRIDIENFESEIVIFNEYLPAIKGLEEYSHIYVIYYMHKAVEKCRKNTLTVKPGRKLVKKLGIDEKELPEVGVFSTRSPCRPNSIGLSIVQLIEIKENILKVRGLDAYNGTPVLDIKPYTPFDIIENIKISKWLNLLINKLREGSVD